MLIRLSGPVDKASRLTTQRSRVLISSAVEFLCVWACKKISVLLFK